MRNRSDFARCYVRARRERQSSSISGIGCRLPHPYANSLQSKSSFWTIAGLVFERLSPIPVRHRQPPEVVPEKLFVLSVSANLVGRLSMHPLFSVTKKSGSTAIASVKACLVTDLDHYSRGGKGKPYADCKSFKLCVRERFSHAGYQHLLILGTLSAM